MTPDERLTLVLEFAVVLYVNGQATEQMLAATARLSRALELDVVITPRWGVLDLVANDKDRTLIAQAAADPAGVEMDRVASAMRAIDNIVSGQLAADSGLKTIRAISQSAPAPTWQFSLAAAAGAAALAVIFGVQHISAAALIFLSAGDGLIAAVIILAMSLGLVVPKLAIDYFSDRLAQPAARGKPPSR